VVDPPFAGDSICRAVVAAVEVEEVDRSKGWSLGVRWAATDRGTLLDQTRLVVDSSSRLSVCKGTEDQSVQFHPT